MYIVMEIQTNSNNQVATIVTDYEDKAQALNKYYTILAAASISQVYIHAAMIVNEFGEPILHSAFRHTPSEQE